MNTNIICLIIIILLILKFSRNSASIVEKFRSGTSPAYLSFIADDHLYVFHLKAGYSLPKGRQTWWKNKTGFKRIGYVKCCNRLVRMKIKDFKGGDKIIFYYLNTGGPGYIAGHVWWNGNFYPTNNVDYKCTGLYSRYKENGRNFRKSGKRIGCFRDGPSRRLRYVAGFPISNEACREKAIQRNHKYYSLQYGGQCFTDNDIFRAKSYGKLPDWKCNMRGKTRRTRWTQRQGGGWANDLYHARKAPNLRNCGKANKRGIHSGAYKIKTEQGPYCSHSELGWVEITFETKKAIEPVEYCPHPAYTEFNGSACTDNQNVSSCFRSAKKGFIPKMSQCINKLDVSYNNYENKDFYTIISTALERNFKYVSKDKITKLYDSMKALLKIACSIKSTADNVDYEDEDKCEQMVKKMFSSDDNSYMFFGIISDAHKLCKNPKMGNPKICANFRNALKEVIRNARIINFSSNEKQFKCACPRDFSKSLSIVAKDTAHYILKHDSTKKRNYTINNLNLTGNMTISVWLKPSEINRSRKNIFDAGYNGEGSLTLERNGTITYYYGARGGYGGGYQGFGSRIPIQINKLTHVAIVRNLSQRKLQWYINGKLTATTRAKHGRAGRTSWRPKIGRGYTGRIYQGVFHHLRIYKRALRVSEITNTVKEGLSAKNSRKCGPC